MTIECWGAQGGDTEYGSGGKGGYALGTLTVSPGETLYIFVGEKGSRRSGGWNGGGVGGYSFEQGTDGCNGGGASDVRQGGTALSNRKIVAGGGGGAGAAAGGSGGGTSGVKGSDGYGAIGGNPGTQSTGYAFGSGSNGYDALYDPAGGGGGGYYGGYAGGTTDDDGAGGGGGSGYVGGVTASQLIAGNAPFPVPGGGSETGHSGNGVVKITWSEAASYPAYCYII